MIKKYVIGRPYPHSNVLHIDKNEYGFIIVFDSIEDAKRHLYEHGYTDEKIEALGIVIEEIKVENGTPEFLENFIFDIWSCCNEADYSISCDLDDYYRLAVTADRNGWNCELLYNKDIDDVVRNEFIHKTNFREIPEAISRLHDHYEESKGNDDESDSEEDEDEDEDPDCQICGCQTELVLVKDFDGKGFDKRLCPKCLLNEALKKGKLNLFNAHFEKDGVMLPVFNYLNTILDIEPLKKPTKKHNNLYYLFKEDTEELKKELDELTTFIDRVEIYLDYSEPISKQTYEKYEKAIARREEIEKFLAERSDNNG